MTHADLVLRAVRWLRSHHKCGLAFAEIVTGAPETPDAIGWRAGFSRVVEVKVSRSDFFADRKKPHASWPDAGMGGQRWYLVPAGLVRANEVPAWCGLAVAHARRIEVVRAAPERDRWDARGEAQVLTSALRRMELGSRFDPKTGRWETYVEREAREAASRGSSRGSDASPELSRSKEPRKPERVNGIEPSTFSLGSMLPAMGTTETPRKPEPNDASDAGKGDGK